MTPNKKVEATIRANCGCGFRTTELGEAWKHCLETRHKLTVLGEIKPTAPRLEVTQ